MQSTQVAYGKEELHGGSAYWLKFKDLGYFIQRIQLTESQVEFSHGPLVIIREGFLDSFCDVIFSEGVVSIPARAIAASTAERQTQIIKA